MAIRLRRDTGDLEVNHEINVTPFIDVILVLLIVFMVAAPLATVDIAVDLPASTAARQLRPDAPVYLTIRASHALSIGDTPVPEGGLGLALDRVSGGDKDRRVFLRADKTVDYDTLMRTMNELRAAGYLKIALVGLDWGGPPLAAPAASIPATSAPGASIPATSIPATSIPGATQTRPDQARPDQVP